VRHFYIIFFTLLGEEKNFSHFETLSENDIKMNEEAERVKKGSHLRPLPIDDFSEQKKVFPSQKENIWKASNFLFFSFVSFFLFIISSFRRCCATKG
jgi:hypothetical protein